MEKGFDKIRLQSRRFKRVQGLMNYVNVENLKAEHRRQLKNKAVGVDGITKIEYERNIIENIEDLINRMRQFSYKPKPVRRVYIPKSNGKKRPLGIPSYEDKLVQGVMSKVLNSVYEPRFLDMSYGFREGRNAHQAVRKVNQTIMTKKVNYIVDADIKGFFDNVSHEWLIKFLENDIEDKKFIRYIKRFLYAGLVENTKLYASDSGTPQGGLISPVLANVYLHYVLDLWFEKRIKERYRGEAYIVRYADDFICMFQYEKEARLFYQDLVKRLKKFGLKIAEDKTDIMPFGRFAQSNHKEIKSFDFLGFRFINGKTRTNKYRVVVRTSKKKLKEKKQVANEWFRSRRHEDVLETIDKLNRKLVGHYRYYGVNGNFTGLMGFYKFIVVKLYKTLIHRSQRKYLTWERYWKLLKKHPIITPKIYVNIW